MRTALTTFVLSASIYESARELFMNQSGSDKKLRKGKFTEELENMSDDQLQAFAEELGYTPDWEESQAVAESAPAPADVEMFSETITKENGEKITVEFNKLAYIGRTRAGAFKFAYGTSTVIVDTVALRVLNGKKPFQVGQELPVNNIEWNPKYNAYTGNVVVSLHEDLNKVRNFKTDSILHKKDYIANAIAEGATPEQAEAEYNADAQDRRKQLLANRPTLSL